MDEPMKRGKIYRYLGMGDRGVKTMKKPMYFNPQKGCWLKGSACPNNRRNGRPYFIEADAALVQFTCYPPEAKPPGTSSTYELIEVGGLYRYLGMGPGGLELEGRRKFPVFFNLASTWSSGSRNPIDRASGVPYFEKKAEVAEVPPTGVWRPASEPIPDDVPGDRIVYIDKKGNRVGMAASRTWWIVLPPTPEPPLPDPVWINGNHRAKFDRDGSIHVGCQSVSFEKLKEVYKLAKRTREESE
jgi:hypothetical protein